jgi:enoyl-CoA hydratase/carnithine racemase
VWRLPAPTHEHVRVDKRGPVAIVTIDRPGTRNACTFPMWLAIRDVFRQVATSGARAVVLCGANGDFCSGADVTRLARDDGFEGSQLDVMRLVSQSVLAVHECPIPVVVKVDGVAAGAGFGLALAGDLLYCSDRARFSAIFARVGMSLDYGTSWLLVRRIGLHLAKEMTFTADVLDSERARELGFVNAVVPVGELDTRVEELVGQIAAKAPTALSLSKRLLDHAANASLSQALEMEAIAQSLNLTTEETKDALRAAGEGRRRKA